MEFPMIALRIDGTGGYVELSIDELFGYPKRISYGGGYGAKGILSITSGNYSVIADHYFTTGELYHFYRELKKCHESVSGKAILHNTENELELSCEFDKLGHVLLLGRFQEISSVDNILQFEIHTDQTQIRNALPQLSNVVSIFGDDNGITDK